MPKSKPFEKNHTLTNIEKEVITLKAVFDLINEMVNREMMVFHIGSPYSSVMFHRGAQKALFNILLVDLISVPKGFFDADLNYIERIREVCLKPQFGNTCVDFLKTTANDFLAWLSESVIIENRWFCSIGLEIDLTIKRQDLITICGNMAKHNFTQQTRQAQKFQRILRDNGEEVSLDSCLLALSDCREQLYDDIFAYHIPTITEFLNNIRWGIYYYASPQREACVREFLDAYHNLPSYSYDFPTEVVSKIGKEYYWALMDDVNRPPFIEHFKVDELFKRRY